MVREKCYVFDLIKNILIMLSNIRDAEEILFNKIKLYFGAAVF